jgi:signal transduction histidine kinase
MSRAEVGINTNTDAVQFSWPCPALSAPLPAVPSSGIVHDLGNLIQVAASALNIISRNSNVESSSDLEPVVTSARISLQRAGELVEQTIRFAREDASAREVVSMGACLTEIEALVKNTWKPHIRCDFEASPDLPLVKCNRLNLQSALMNLLFNARDAMPDGGGVSVRAGVVHEGQVATEIEVRIEDNGLGMSRGTLARAIDPFFTTKTMGLGGLGLPMVMRFVREAGGRLHIESEQGVGTTVILRLPVPG